MASNVIKEGDYVIITRQNYSKLYKVSQNKTSTMLGRDEIDMAPVIGERFWTTYKLERKDHSRRIFTLRKCRRETSFTDSIIKEVRSGADNRMIKDDGLSQKLSTQEILNLRSRGLSGQEIVVQIVGNSTTFKNKSGFSQEKYLKKKERKYFEYVTIRKPSLRLILDVILKQPARALGLRMDTISQMIALANVRSSGIYLLYETGCNGVVTASIMDRLGTNGFVIHVHSGVCPHPTLPVLALNLSEEKLSHLMSVDIHHLCGKVRESSIESEIESSDNADIDVEFGCKRKLDDPAGAMSSKKRKMELEERAVEMLRKEKADGLIICGREHPVNIFKVLSKYLDVSRPFVVYSAIREPLQEMYCYLKARSDVLAIRITENFVRGFQVLPERTHPDININGTGGFLLSGTVTCQWPTTDDPSFDGKLLPDIWVGGRGPHTHYFLPCVDFCMTWSTIYEGVFAALPFVQGRTKRNMRRSMRPFWRWRNYF